MTDHPAGHDDLSPFDDATEIAEQQFDEIYEGPDVDLANAVVAAWELIMQMPEVARATSNAFTADGKIVLGYPVPGYDMAIFWTTDGPRIEAIFPHP